jgi:hypothetical protein
MSFSRLRGSKPIRDPAHYRTLVRPMLPSSEELTELAPWFIAVDATEWDGAPLGETIAGCPVVPLAFLESGAEIPTYSYALN